ncbi:MAG: c-type cytochrome biogenesis protein CcsB [Actinobacteria bacterium]|nr:c-type cytochrome biogenesis protein CcsB [Actinomycetota bacterium]
MTSASLAEWSNLAVYSSMLVLIAALICFAVSFAARGQRVMTSQRVPVGAGAPMEQTTATVSDPRAPGARAGNVAMALTWLATGLLLLGLVLRGLWAGRVPWGNMYEFSLAWTFGILAVFLVVSTRRDIRWLGLPVVFLALLSLGLAVTVLYTEAAQLVPALKSWWLVIHVASAIICGGAFTVAAAISVLYLWRDRAERKGNVTGIVASLPDAARLDTLSYRILAFAFPLWTFAVISGAIWAENAWGRYWGWDPKETWAFITWVIYAGYLHARSTAGWRGRRAAYISLLGFVSFLINYFGVNIFVNSLHSYAGL